MYNLELSTPPKTIKDTHECILMVINCYSVDNLPKLTVHIQLSQKIYFIHNKYKQFFNTPSQKSSQSIEPINRT